MQKKNQKAFTLIELMLAIAIMSIGIGITAYNFSKASNASQVSNLQQSILSIRTQIQQLFMSSADFTGLNTDLVINTGSAPKNLIKGGKLINNWGGDIVITGSGSTFTISISNVPKDECTKLASFQADSWLSIAINSSKLSNVDVVNITNTCNNPSNTLIFESR